MLWRQGDTVAYGASFGFILYEDLQRAAACDEVKAALAAKISKESIGAEIDLVVSGNQPVKVMTYICDLTLFWIVVNLPPKSEPAVSAGCDRCCLEPYSINRDEQRRLSLFAALLLPFKEITYKDNKPKKIPIVNYIFRESLKRKASDAETVINIHKSLEKFLSLIPYLVSTEDVKPFEVDWGRELVDDSVPLKLRVLTGFILREIKDFWRVALLMSILLYPGDVDHTDDILNKHFQLDKRRDLFEAVENAITKLGLEKQQKLLAWQLAHPSGTAEDCLDWMKESHSKLVKLESGNSVD
ncbi:hypothetical protein Patl1_07803 [Pistacia atlantica]|uniref:Uncharacterized protein n=1 Tax=Pistacia atlantica TaxID=434234 RepID=A0ACC1AI38_9ROSI|nr:hypothetical protein Patl1_07803 [Pistacia atlantica]